MERDAARFDEFTIDQRELISRDLYGLGVKEHRIAAAVELELPGHHLGRAPELDHLGHAVDESSEIEVREQREVDERVPRLEIAASFEERDGPGAVACRVVVQRLAEAYRALDRRHELEPVLVAWRDRHRRPPVLAVCGRCDEHDPRIGRIVERFGQAAPVGGSSPRLEHHREKFVVVAERHETVRPRRGNAGGAGVGKRRLIEGAVVRHDREGFSDSPAAVRRYRTEDCVGIIAAIVLELTVSIHDGISYRRNGDAGIKVWLEFKKEGCSARLS